MRGRPYLRGPIELRVAKVLGAGAIGLVVLGLVLDALPEEGALEWNGLPLGEYGLADLWVGIVVLALLGAVCAAVALWRGRELTTWERRIAVGIVVLGGTALALTAAILLLVIAVCGSGACN
jgi:hypothetical protein